MVNVGTLDARLTLDTKAFRSSLKKAQTSAKSASRNMERNFKGLEKGFGRLKTSLAAVFTGVVIGQFVSAGEELELVRQRLVGVTGSAEGATETIAELASLSQTLSTDVVDLANSFAILGTQGLANVESVEALNNVAAFTGRSVEQVTQALVSLEAETVRNNFAITAFNKSGETFTVTMNDGTKAVLQGRKAVQEFLINTGLLEDRMKAGAAASGDFSTQMDNVRTTLSIASLTFRDLLAPALQRAAEGFANLSLALINMSDETKQAISQFFVDQVDRLARLFHAISTFDFSNLSGLEKISLALVALVGSEKAARGLFNTLRPMGALVANIGVGFAGVSIALSKMGPALNTILAKVAQLGSRFGLGAISVEATGTALTRVAAAASEVVAAFAPWVALIGAVVIALASVVKGLVEALGITVEWSDALGPVAVVFESILFVVDKFLRAMRIILGVVKNVGKFLFNAFTAVAKVIEATTEAAVALFYTLKEMLDPLGLFGSTAEESAKKADTALRALIGTSKELTQDLKDMGDAIGADNIDTGPIINTFETIEEKSNRVAEEVRNDTSVIDAELKKITQSLKKVTDGASDVDLNLNTTGAETLAGLPDVFTALNAQILKVNEQMEKAPLNELERKIYDIRTLYAKFFTDLQTETQASLDAQGAALGVLTEQLAAANEILAKDNLTETQTADAKKLIVDINAQIAAGEQELIRITKDRIAGEKRIHELKGDSLRLINDSVGLESTGFRKVYIDLLIRSAQAMSNLNGVTDTQRQRLNEVAQEMRKLTETANKNGESTKAQRDRMKELGDELKRIKAAMQDAGASAESYGQKSQNATSGVDALRGSTAQLRAELADTAAQANSTAGALAGVGSSGGTGGFAGGSSGGGGRQNRNLGPVVSGDVNDPANIQRAINSINAQRRTVSQGGDVWGFSRIQLNALNTELARLEANLQFATDQQNSAIVDTIVNTFIGQGLTGDQLNQAVEDALRTRQRFGASGSTNTNAGFPGTQNIGGIY